tara:strand:+ start:53 stop:565 length:513 start_codon:yes stop_codon:yes gene_type:complete
MATFPERIIRAAKLDVNIYEEVESNPAILGQSMLVVILSSLAMGIASLSRPDSPGLLESTGFALASWFLWAFITYFIGTRILPMPQTHATLGQLLRTTGFAAAPGILRILGIVPLFGSFILGIIHIWMLTAMVIAVRQALDYTNTFRAVAVCLIGWIPSVVLLSILTNIL